MNALARLLAALAVMGMAFAAFAPPASAAMVGSACAGKGECCAATAKAREHAKHESEHSHRPVSTECPPPMIPEVPTTVLLPLSAAAVAGVVVVGARRRTRTRTPRA